MSNELNSLLLSPFMNLNNIYRFSNTHIIERETTAEHTICMQLICMYFYNEEAGIDINDLIMRCLYHDMDECVCADIPRDFKYATKESIKMFNDISNNLLKQSGILTDIINKINLSKHDGSINGAFIQVIDVLQCTIKLYHEYLLQGTDVLKLRLQQAICTLNDCINSYEKLLLQLNQDNNLVSYQNCLNRFKDIFNEFKAKLP